MRTHSLILAALSLTFAVGSLALAEPTTPAAHGDRAYRDALRFAQDNQLPHFTVRSGGAQRLVVNVPNNKIQAWCNTFSKQNCYVEPFFDASHSNAPGWSRLRMGNQAWSQYGAGSEYRTNTWSGRLAFPVSLTQQELASAEQKILTSPNGPWNYNGGDPERSGRNCTNWVTYKLGQYTGVTTCSVVHHCSSLMTGRCSPRMSVVAVMSENPIPNFGQEQLVPNWPGH